MKALTVSGAKKLKDTSGHKPWSKTELDSMKAMISAGWSLTQCIKSSEYFVEGRSSQSIKSKWCDIKEEIKCANGRS